MGLPVLSACNVRDDFFKKNDKRGVADTLKGFFGVKIVFVFVVFQEGV